MADLSPVQIAAAQTTVTVVLAYDTEPRIPNRCAEQTRPRSAGNAKTRPDLARVLAIEHERVVRSRATLALALGAQAVFRGARIHEHAPALETHFEAQAVSVRMGRQVVRPNRRDVAYEIKWR